MDDFIATGKQVNLCNLQDHPIAETFYKLSLQLEELGGGVEQTALLIKLTELRQATQDYINSNQKEI